MASRSPRRNDANKNRRWKKQRQQRHRRLLLEALEDRRLLSVTTEGDGILNADDVRTRFAAYGTGGIDGSGVKIGVISEGAENWTSSRDSGDLPTTIMIDSSDLGSGDQGTAMMEVIYDVAPGAQLYFSAADDNAEMVDSIDWLVTQGVNVIVDELGFFYQPYQPFFEDGTVAQAAASAVTDDDVTYVSAAGKGATFHYQAEYVATADTPFPHDFDTTGSVDTGLDVTIADGETFEAVLQWSDPFGGSGNDYELVLRDESDSLVKGSFRTQDGDDDPWEHISYTYNKVDPDDPEEPGSIDVYLRIEAVISAGSAPETRELELFMWGPTPQQYGTTADSIYGQAAVESVITVVVPTKFLPLWREK